MKIIIHTKPAGTCPSCDAAKQYFKDSKVEFEEICHPDFAERNRFYDSLGLIAPNRTVPQIFIQESSGSLTRVGGWTELRVSDVVARAHLDDTNFEEDF